MQPRNRIRSAVAAIAAVTAVVATVAMAVIAALALTLGAVALLSGPALAASEQAQITKPQAPSQLRAAVPSPAARRFLAIARANFGQWDLDHDGVLTREEIEVDMQNPSIVGDAAAALAALKLGSTTYRDLSQTRSFTPASLDAMERDLVQGRKLDRNFVGFYAAGLHKLAEQPRDLFVAGGPRISAIRQDFTSDCYFLSAVGALAQANPQAIVRLIARNDDGSFTVGFPHQPPVRVPAPTDSEIATYTIAKDGIWLSVLEKAYAMLRIRHAPQETATREPLDSVGFRLGSTRVMELLNGHDSRAIGFPAITHKPLDPGLVAQTRTEIRSALQDHRVVTVSNSSHAYAVVAYDAGHDLVTVRNPYGRGGVESWITDGDSVRRNEEGFFVIPTARLVGNFNYVRLEVGGDLAAGGRSPVLATLAPPIGKSRAL
ncbi:MAG TPA: C2 family cysteine protease [Xanthobacteraceae bacterium]